jgi:hypothetical protein
MRAPRPGLLALAFALIGMSLGISLALHFTLHTSLDLDADGQSAPSHQCPADHINIVHSGLRDSQIVIDRAPPDAACAAAATLEPVAPRYVDEASAYVLVSAEYTSIVSARGPPARL